VNREEGKVEVKIEESKSKG